MKILDKLLSKLRRGTATQQEIENLDRRLFCLGAAASVTGGLIARPTIVDLGVSQPLVTKLPAWVLESGVFPGALPAGLAAYVFARGHALGYADVLRAMPRKQDNS